MIYVAGCELETKYPTNTSGSNPASCFLKSPCQEVRQRILSISQRIATEIFRQLLIDKTPFMLSDRGRGHSRCGCHDTKLVIVILRGHSYQKRLSMAGSL